MIERTRTGYSAYSPDLPGCVATGKTEREVEKNIYDAIEMHLEGMLEDGTAVPEPRSSSVYALISKPVKA